MTNRCSDFSRLSEDGPEAALPSAHCGARTAWMTKPAQRMFWSFQHLRRELALHGELRPPAPRPGRPRTTKGTTEAPLEALRAIHTPKSAARRRFHARCGRPGGAPSLDAWRLPRPIGSPDSRYAPGCRGRPPEPADSSIHSGFPPRCGAKYRLLRIYSSTPICQAGSATPRNVCGCCADSATVPAARRSRLAAPAV